MRRAGRKHQRSRDGRRDHADRQARYREKVTHHRRTNLAGKPESLHARWDIVPVAADEVTGVLDVDADLTTIESATMVGVGGLDDAVGTGGVLRCARCGRRSSVARWQSLAMLRTRARRQHDEPQAARQPPRRPL